MKWRFHRLGAPVSDGRFLPSTNWKLEEKRHRRQKSSTTKKNEHEIARQIHVMDPRPIGLCFIVLHGRFFYRLHLLGRRSTALGKDSLTHFRLFKRFATFFI